MCTLYIHVYMYTQTNTQTHTHTNSYTNPDTHTHTYTHTHAQTRTRTNTRTHAHTHIRTHTHTHTHTHQANRKQPTRQSGVENPMMISSSAHSTRCVAEVLQWCCSDVADVLKCVAVCCSVAKCVDAPLLVPDTTPISTDRHKYVYTFIKIIPCCTRAYTYIYTYTRTLRADIRI